jgi:hypothetical protein
MANSSETWVPVVSFGGRFIDYYQVSSTGLVRSSDRVDSRGRRLRGKVLAPRPHSGGYLRVGLYRDGVEHGAYIHRLVAEAFIGPCPDGMEVLHGRAGKADNSLANIRYDTHEINCEDRTRDQVPRARLTRAAAAEIRARVAAGEPQGPVARDFGVNVSTISRVVHRRRWAH